MFFETLGPPKVVQTLSSTILNEAQVGKYPVRHRPRNQNSAAPMGAVLDRAAGLAKVNEFSIVVLL